MEAAEGGCLPYNATV